MKKILKSSLIHGQVPRLLTIEYRYKSFPVTFSKTICIDFVVSSEHLFYLIKHLLK